MQIYAETFFFKFKLQPCVLIGEGKQRQFTKQNEKAKLTHKKPQAKDYVYRIRKLKFFSQLIVCGAPAKSRAF